MTARTPFISLAAKKLTKMPKVGVTSSYDIPWKWEVSSVWLGSVSKCISHDERLRAMTRSLHSGSVSYTPFFPKGNNFLNR